MGKEKVVGGIIVLCMRRKIILLSMSMEVQNRSVPTHIDLKILLYVEIEKAHCFR